MDYPNVTHGRLINPQGRRFWAWTLDGKRLSTSSGKIGKTGRTTARNYSDRAKAERDVDTKIYAKLRNGYQFWGAENPGPILLQTWITDKYTGFHSLDIDAERNLIAACRHTGQGQKSCEVLIIDVVTGAIERQIRLNEFDISTLRFFATNVLIQADDRIMDLNLKTGLTSLLGTRGVFPHMCFDLQNGHLLYSNASDGLAPSIQVLDLPTGKILLELDASAQRYVTDHRISHVGALSPSGGMAAICRRPGEIEIHDLQNQSCRYLRGDFPCVAKLQFHPSEKWLAFTELYGNWRFQMWRIVDELEDTRFESLEYTFPDGTPRSRKCFDFAFSPDGNLALRDRDWIRLHDFETQSTIAYLQQRYVARPWGTGGFYMLFARDNRLITRTDRGILTVYELGNDRIGPNRE